MEQLRILINLTRLNKPIGFMLLFWPCAWGLALSIKVNPNLDLFFYYLILFFLGSVLMRSAGCIINDVVDKDIDQKVERTKKRPIASKQITIKNSLLLATTLCAIAFLILIQFNSLTIILGIASMFLAFSYPFMKRVTYWPQLFLGLTFNWGIIMAWASINNSISLDIIILYISAIFWTLGYDTIYGVQDMFDDEIIGVKSTSLKFKKNIKLFVGFCYFLNIIFLTILFNSSIGLNFSTLFLIIFLSILIYQIKIFEKEEPLKCLKAFKSNNLAGMFLFISILLS